MSTQGTPTRLHSGEWGAKVHGSVNKGDRVTITTRAGKSWDTTVRKVVWSGDGVSICATEPRRNGYTPARRNNRGYVIDRGHYDGYCGYPCPVSGRKCCPANGPCHDCA